jgi:ABC-type branched-subunit amino acid transport system ATPase component
MFVEHHMGLVMQVAERIIVLDAGQMIAEGTPAQIATDARVVDAYLGTNK